ncbi:MAG: glycosyltransferase [Deltaproteobacteria bacterium]|nr:glycosyltransferase [Deltaproteobacteria bacterium]
MISNIRLIGVALGLVGFIIVFIHFRGARWRRNSFVLLTMCSIAILAVSIDPDLVNVAQDIFLFKDISYGRILALLMLTSMFLSIFTLYLYDKIEKLKRNNDLMFHSLSLFDSEMRADIKKLLRPITILIPAYNEAENLRILLAKMPQQVCGLDVSVLVIDDGSTDETRDVLEELGVPYLRNIINRGQGAASRLGYNLLKVSNVQIGVTMDADNQHRPEDLDTLVRPILENKSDLVIGSRRLGETKSRSLLRNIGVVFYSSVISLFIGVKLTDCSSGYKAFSRRWMTNVILLEDQFQSTEVLITTVKKGLRVSEVPVTIECRTHGKSKKGTDLFYAGQVAKALIKAWWRK